ncbi:ribonuclease III domain-containing protein [Sporodiniella umbellata]|nr:ribonuclease III domain-containing protein [Sporodiniella umbellata]
MNAFFARSIIKANTSRVSAAFLHTPSVNALRARLGLDSLDTKTFSQALSHIDGESGNTDLKFVGQRVTGLFATEYFHVKYPQLHPKAFDKTLGAYIGERSFARIAEELGFQHSIDKSDGTYTSKALSSCLYAVIGAVYQENGPDAAKRFVHDFVLVRDLDIKPFIRLDEPKRSLTALMRQLGQPKAESRLLSETGRLSSAPVFVVGVFSGQEKLAEGFGSSLKMAEFRACQNALANYYGKESKDFTLPSEADKVKEYTPAPLGTTQAIV